MIKDSDYYKGLLSRYLNNACTPAEAEELFSYLEKDESNRVLLGKLKSEFFDASPTLRVNHNYEEKVRTALLAQIQPAPVVQMSGRRRWLRIAAAAAVIGILSVSTFLLLRQPTPTTQTARPVEHLDRFKNDVLPGGEKAVLVLANGEKIILDSAGNGMLTEQGTAKIIKLENGQLRYNAAAGKGGEVVYNTIVTPRGGQYQIILPDETKVWLNASSSLRFPTAFVGKERRVEISGEAYFEVEKNPSQPFLVSINGGSEVEVLGTHFNIMAYADERVVKTTLLEGAVNFRNGAASKKLRPGQQVQLQNSTLKLEDNVDIDQVVAWKNGLFDFSDDVIPDIMRQLSRWYDIEVVYDGPVPEGHYAGAVRRQSNISEVLKMLELAGDVRFEIQGKKVTVKKQS
ncbi:MAG TPA: FecR domain-containing protein [Flavisolibacter sp.]|nr:FecR domain-containing protein [Flavisolibacter sp.]